MSSRSFDHFIPIPASASPLASVNSTKTCIAQQNITHNHPASSKPQLKITAIRNGRLISHAPCPGHAVAILLLQPRPPRRERPSTRSLHTPSVRTVDLSTAEHVLPEAIISTLPALVPPDCLRKSDDHTRSFSPANVPEADYPDPASGVAISPSARHRLLVHACYPTSIVVW